MLDISANNIKKNHFGNLENLTDLNLAENNLESIEADSFYKLKNLGKFKQYKD